ncbi:hypothetical protein MKW92_018623 [Papaver armeniacum]|nr:hypothetical protein MKW92_018623 [Papaver armeniacum]
MEIESNEDGASVTNTNKEKEEYGGVIGSIHIPSLESSESSVVDLTGHVHQLPCCIKHDGPSSVSQYFKPIKSGIEMENGISVEETHFRGRKLQGANIPLPQGYSEEGSDSWETCAKFQSIMYWNHDNIPSQDDVLLRSFHWFKIANALHAPVPVDDLASMHSLPC